MKIYHPNTLDAGLLKGFYTPFARHLLGLLASPAYRLYHRLASARQTSSRNFAWYRGKPIFFKDKTSFLSNFADIFIHNYYDIGPINGRLSFIDGGSNIGLATIYWHLRYGAIEGFAFEPDPELASLLQKNLSVRNINKTRVIVKALSNKEGLRSFCSTGTDSGRLTHSVENSNAGKTVKTSTLGNFLQKPIHILKLDIEGEELAVLTDVKKELGGVEKIFVECHDYSPKKQFFADVFHLLKDAGYRCHVRTGVPPKNLWMGSLSADFTTPTQTINIFAFRDVS